MKTTKVLITTLVVLVTALSSCYWNNWDKIHPVSTSTTTTTTINCDTTAVSYSLTIVPTLTASCQINNGACHMGSHSSGYDLSTYGGVKGAATGGSGSTMYLAITGTPPYNVQGSSKMPQTGTPLTSCQINQILAWSNAGCPDN